MDDDQFLEAYLNTLEVSEGTEGGDTVTGMATRPYGVKDLLGVNEQDYKDNPRGLAKAVASKNIDELKRMGIEWDKLPNSMKFNALDIQFNMGSLNKKAPKYFKAVKAGKYDTAIKESLDAIGAYDPKRKGERPTKGIALRRAKLYNMVADELGYPTITSVKAINQDNPQKSAKVTYNLSEGESIPVTYSSYSLHSTTKPGTESVSKTFGMTVQPTTVDQTEGFSEPVTVTPQPQPAPEPAPVAPETKAQTDEAFTLDYEGELPDIGDEVKLPDLPETDVAPDTTDAIPPAMVDVPEDKNIFERAYDYMFGDKDTPEKIQQREQTRQRLLQSLEMNEGGMAIEKQMEMFEDGGLMDEGGTVDPVSGNDVPPGSTQEEVRDDIPAQLSEGEFVFPADVVRFIGLEKLMQMRQEAKAGLARMEAMGQMGNSEEAVLPDDIPFDLDDLDMEDEPMEFQTGGLVPNPYGTYQQASQFATYGQQPYQAPQLPTAPMAPQAPLQTGFQPLTTPVQPVTTATGTVPSFEDIMPTTTGRYDELKEYINQETGESMTIPFVDGKPIYPIPQGFIPKPTEQVEAVVPETTVVPTTRVQEEGDDEGRPEPRGAVFALGTSSELGRMTGKRGEDYFDFDVSFDSPSGGMIPGISGALGLAGSLAAGKGIPEGTVATLRYGDTELKLNADEYNEAKADRTGSKAQEIIQRFKEKRDDERNAAKALAAEYGIKYTGQSLAEMAKAANKIDEERKARDERTKAIIQKAIEESGDTGQTTGTGGAPAETFTTAGEQSIQDLLASLDSGNDDSGGGGSSSGGGRTGSSSTDWSQPDSSASVGSQSDYDKMYGNQGGLASKPKPKAKKMKQGGLASKK